MFKVKNIIIILIPLLSFVSLASILEKPVKERRMYYKENSVKFESRCAAKTDTNKALKQKVKPIKIVEPVYPSKAARKKIEGFVVMEFDLVAPEIPHHLRGENVPEIFKDEAAVYQNSPRAIPTNINIIEHYPSYIFDKAAKRALQQWVYQTKNNEKFVKQECLKIHLDFLVSN